MEQYLGQIIYFAGDFAPDGWAICDGRLLPIQSNESLYHLLGTRFGGDGTNTFGLPDLRGRLGVGVGHMPGGDTYTVGQKSGTEATLVQGKHMPEHTHDCPLSDVTTDLKGTSIAGSFSTPVEGCQVSTVAVSSGEGRFYKASPDGATVPLGGAVLTNAGGADTGQAGKGLPQNNVMPFVALTALISLSGQFPQP